MRNGGQNLDLVDSGEAHSFYDAMLADTDFGIGAVCAGFCDDVLASACQAKDVRCCSAGGECTVRPLRGRKIKERA